MFGSCAPHQCLRYNQYSVQHAELNAQFIVTVSLYQYFTLFYVIKNRTLSHR